MKQLVFLCLLSALVLESTSKIVMTKDEWVNKLITLANSKSRYTQEYPYNVLYYDGTTWSADCSNLMKALFNGRDISDKTANQYQRDLSNTGDVTVDGLINLCTDISTNFSKLKSGEPRILYMPGHMGAYLGKVVKTSKGECNVVESTPAWDDGIQFSYVDSTGKRLYAKGRDQRSTWTKHGKPSKWVQY